MLVVLDRQHVGRTVDDLGATMPREWAGYDLPREATLTAEYIATAEQELRKECIRVVVMSDGSYSDRHARVSLHPRTGEQTLYVACHINAGGDDYGLVAHDYRSNKGGHAASILAKALADSGLVARGVAQPVYPKCHPDDPWCKLEDETPTKFGTWKMHTTIEGIYKLPANVVGVCYEPVFIDNRKHWADPIERLYQTTYAIGHTLAKSAITYLESVS